MKSESYYRVLTDIDNNFETDEVFLRANCTGHTIYSGEIKANTSRKDFYLIYLVKGSINITLPNVEKPLEPGEVIIFTPNRMFTYYKPDGVELEYYWVHFTGSRSGEIVEKCGLCTGKIIPVGIHTGLKDGFSKLFRSFILRGAFFDMEAATALSNILLDIGKYADSQHAEKRTEETVIKRSLEFIHDNMSKSIKVEELAQIEHMSPSRFREVFRKATGLSPKEYITLMKLGYSSELIRQTDLSIKEISAVAGYDDPQYFNRIFKKHFGMAPGTYRKRVK